MPHLIRRTAAVALLSLLPSLARAVPPATQPTLDQQTQALAEKWKPRLAAEHFNLLLASPFVIAGDGTPQQLADYRDHTILASVRALNTQFFTKPLTHPVLILLFETDDSYRRLVQKWFDQDVASPYGFYRHHDRTMLMNVGTGTGTLVHELAHALIAPDFPAVPDWFNEGLASLYEQSQFTADGKIRGLTNWRLRGLQAAIKSQKLRSLTSLITEPDFRAERNVGINYAAARYLMLNLQEKNLLQKYYSQFRDNHEDDPTGFETLKHIIAPQSLEDFEKAWIKWVQTLQFNP